MVAHNLWQKPGNYAKKALMNACEWPLNKHFLYDLSSEFMHAHFSTNWYKLKGILNTHTGKNGEKNKDGLEVGKA